MAVARKRTRYLATDRPYYLRGRCLDCSGVCSSQARRCKPCDTKRQRKLSLTTKPEYVRRKRAVQRERNTGMSAEYFDELLSAQEWCCAICAVEITEASGHADHNHETGGLRGVLCGNCNRALGIMGDSADRLRAAAEYLIGYEA